MATFTIATLERSQQPTQNLVLNAKNISIIVVAMMAFNVFAFSWFGYNSEVMYHRNVSELYLLDQAGLFVSDTYAFEQKVREVSRRLDIPAEWLMAVMYSESKFDASAENRKGSGAVGLIQWMPETAKDFGQSTQNIKKLSHIEQLDIAYNYLNRVRQKYGEFKSLGHLYLGILYPKAMSGDFCYTLYAKPSTAYQQNAGLDEDQDGRVTVRDIDKRMRRIYPTAYQKEKADG